ncbi:hypothetical protein AMK15_19285 [Streptomyces sp. MJM1172]|nr:hypothetical protein AMK15_19285 [Streptomyces sp. MJM1172]
MRRGACLTGERRSSSPSAGPLDAELREGGELVSLSLRFLVLEIHVPSFTITGSASPSTAMGPGHRPVGAFP